MDVNVALGHYMPISDWKPQVGDTVVWHGLLQHWFGVVNSVDPGTNSVSIIKSGLPLLLLTMDQKQYDKSTKIVSINEIRNSRGGKYAAQRAHSNNTIWYV